MGLTVVSLLGGTVVITWNNICKFAKHNVRVRIYDQQMLATLIEDDEVIIVAFVSTKQNFMAIKYCEPCQMLHIGPMTKV